MKLLQCLRACALHSKTEFVFLNPPCSKRVLPLSWEQNILSLGYFLPNVELPSGCSSVFPNPYPQPMPKLLVDATGWFSLRWLWAHWLGQLHWQMRCLHASHRHHGAGGVCSLMLQSNPLHPSQRDLIPQSVVHVQKAMTALKPRLKHPILVTRRLKKQVQQLNFAHQTLCWAHRCHQLNKRPNYYSVAWFLLSFGMQ